VHLQLVNFYYRAYIFWWRKHVHLGYFAYRQIVDDIVDDGELAAPWWRNLQQQKIELSERSDQDDDDFINTPKVSLQYRKTGCIPISWFLTMV